MKITYDLLQEFQKNGYANKQNKIMWRKYRSNFDLEKGLKIEFYTPGVDAEDLQVHKEDGHYIFELGGERYYHRKLKGYGLDYTKIKLHYKNGLLTCEVPISKHKKKIPISVS